MKHTRLHQVAVAVAALAVAAAGSACAFRVDDGAPLDRTHAPRAGAQPAAGGTNGSVAPEGDDTAGGANGANGAAGGGTVAPLPAWDPGPLFRGLADGHIQGNVGYAAVDDAADLSSVYDDGWYTQIEVYARRSDGIRVMLQLEVDNESQTPFLQPGLAVRMEPGASYRGVTVDGLGCAGPDSGAGVDNAFAYTDYDQEPCDVGIGTQQDPNDPQALAVTLSATFADDNGDCDPMPGDDGDGTAPLPPDDADPGSTDPGAGDPTTGTPSDGDSDTAHPYARASFVLTR